MEPPRTQPASFGRAVLGLGAVRLLSVTAGFGTGILGARFLGPSGLGAATVALTIGLIAGVVFNVGLNIAAIYLLGRRKEEREAIVGSLTRLALVAGACALLITAASWPILSGLVRAEGRGYLGPLAGLIAASVILYEFGGALVLGLRRMGTYAIAELVRGGATLVLTLLVLAAIAASDGGFVLAAAGGYASGALVSFIATRRMLGHLPLTWDAPIARAALSIGVRGQLGNILQYLNLRLDQLLVPALLQLQAAGIYAIAVRVSEVVAQIASSAASLIFPAVATRDEVASTELTERTVRLAILLVSATAIVLGVISEPLLVVGFGEDFRSGTATVRILLVAMVPLAAARILAGDLKGRGRPGLVSAVMVATLALTVTFDLLLIPMLGIEGAGLASLAAYSGSAVLLAIAFHQTTGASFARLLPGASDVHALARFPFTVMRAQFARPGENDE